MMSAPSRGDRRRRSARLAGSAALLVGVLVALTVYLDVDQEANPADSMRTVGTSWNGTEPVGAIISEVVSSNVSTLEDEDGDQPDWIEIHNPTSSPIDLDGYYLSDDDEEPARWPLPAVDLAPADYLVLFASGKDRRDPEGELHTDFQLAQEGEPVLLIEPDGSTIADRINAVAIPRNASFGRPAESLAQTCYFAFPSPEQPNTRDCFPDVTLGAPTLSHATGFYDDPFELEITAHHPDATIYYTVDGSYPDPDTNPDVTLVYDGPITIVDRTPEPNGISLIPTTVPEHTAFIAPEHSIPKGTAIRARTRHSATSVATFFVGDVPPNGDLAVVALTVDPRFLFDDEIGIQVGGRRYEEWRDSDAYDEDARWSEVEANYFWRGRDWERPSSDELHNAATFVFCSHRHRCDQQQDVGLRVHGGWSRTVPNKSLRIYARDDHGDPVFGAAILENGVRGHQRLILRNSGNDWNRLRFADAFLQELMSGMSADTQAARPAILYINGEYWGIHNIRERYDEHYLAATHGADPDHLVLLDNSTNRRNEVRRADPPAEGFYLAQPYEPDVVEEWFALVQSLATLDPQDPSFGRQVEQAIDTDSFFDFVIAHTFPAIEDWPHNNSRWWRTAGPPQAAPLDGRWRWLIADLDSWGRNERPLDERLPVGLAAEDSDGHPLLFNTLMENPALRERFVLRFTDHLNTTFTPERTTALLRDWEVSLQLDMPDHLERWTTGAMGDWRTHVDGMAGFLEGRPSIQRRHLSERFDLGDERTLTLELSGGVGSLELNGQPLDTHPSPDAQQEGPSIWRGVYFQGQSIELRAEALPGHVFDGWEVDGRQAGPASTIRVTIEGDHVLRPLVDQAREPG